ncbi:hypothetical protein D9758_009418 [Tetrapyrgos nigripes]|uniref:Carboxylic ester hydrolase n=1 Tax=Tetrapyrgos nigripes TaxID=182062 RepID=A0A8H5D2S0_9AGAR|nr:hypothetical protein D9758_009418 [Tetrapyrgos nigripes]
MRYFMFASRSLSIPISTAAQQEALIQEFSYPLHFVQFYRKVFPIKGEMSKSQISAQHSMLSLLLWALPVLATPLLSHSSSSLDARQATSATVTLDYGTFVGVQNNTAGYTSWKGIRFADAPTGDLRWRAPIFPPSSNLGKVNADEFPKSCVSSAQSGSEDCLFLNVFTPVSTTPEDQLPVLMWIHGGGFQSGSSKHFDPVALMQSSAKPFVFVSIQYRLGDFGFLAGSEIEADGDLNAGLLDQRAAMRWTQQYIGLFGGDSSRVTIWGQSGGAGSVEFHLMANGGDSEGLFHAAMGDSPSLTPTPAASGDFLEALFTQYASLAGCHDKSKTSALACLRKLRASQLTAAGAQLIQSQQRLATLYNWAPSLDGNFIQERPVEAYKAGRFANIPVLFGSNTDEGMNWSANDPDPDANTSSSEATEDTLFNFIQAQYDSFTEDTFEDMLQLYPLSDYSNSINNQGAQMYGELRYICTASMIVQEATRIGQTAYHYHYNNDHLGSFHEYELGGFFPGEPPHATYDDNDLALFDTMRQYWTSFVTSGVPEAKNAPTWEPAMNIPDLGASRRMLLQPAPGEIMMEEIGDALASRCTAWHDLSSELTV